uniref:Tyrosine specific protein phosphatases domain-containing protein n=1 Tax=Arcella intermedia TaxID=1963864 RepID=A0A6B2L975_9EUKA
MPVSIEAFWLMVWQKGSGVVLALNKLFEGGQRKGDVYWPTHTPTVKYGLMTIALVNTATDGDVTIRQLTIHNASTSEAPRKVFHISYSGWPDCGVPETTSCIREVAFLLFALQQYANFENECDGPPVIHCSAGVGRTGCFVSLHYILKSGLFWNIEFLSDLSRILKNEVEDVDSSADLSLIHALSVFKISDIVISLRQQRNPVTVQTAKQFEFIFQAIRDEILTPTSLDKVEKFILSFLQPLPDYTSAFPLLPNAWKSCRSQAQNSHPPILPTPTTLTDN